MSFVLAIGVDFAVKEVDAARRSSIKLPSLRDTIKRCGRQEPLAGGVSPTTGRMEIEAYDEVDAFIRRLDLYCSEYNRSRSAEEHIAYFIAISSKSDREDVDDSFAAPYLLSNMMRESRSRWESLPVTVLITATTYARILPKFQDTYRSSIEIQDTKVHQRFREGAARCFVVSPIGPEGSATRKRADEVFGTYVKPACDGTEYQAVRGEMMRGDRITPEIEEALQTSPMVIAYLGSPNPGWNPNVMYEYGQRKALGLPVVVLKDATVNGKSYELPFDLKDERFVDLPETTPTDINEVAPKIRTIRQHMESPDRTKGGWTTIYPSATIDIVIGGHEELSKYIEASPELETLFELRDIKGRTVAEVTEHLAKKMSSVQCEAFLSDQKDILGNLVLGDTRPIAISANVPILFDEHATLRGRAYLPIIVSYLFVQPTNTFRLHLAYIEVTTATRRSDDGKFFKCTLIGHGGVDAEGG